MSTAIAANTTWDIETDVVVVGYGAAGCAAAITAHDAGARVTVLEKMPAGGGNSLLSSGIFFSPRSPEAARYVEALCFNKTSPEIIETYVEGCMRTVGWLKELGAEIEPFEPVDASYPRRIPSWPNFPAADEMEYCIVSGATDGFRAKPLWKLLSGNVESRGIAVMTGTPAKELITDGNGEVVGVVAEREGKRVSVRASKAVVLTCGSFEYNEAMREAYLPYTPLVPIGNPGNTGDGVMMAQKVGAALWHMSAFYGWFVFKTPEYPGGFSINFQAPSFVYVDKGGWRFTNEAGWESHERSKGTMTFLPERPNYPQLPVFAVFDEVARRKAPLVGRVAGISSYQWSLDNSREVERGWIRRANSFAELASQIGIDAKGLVRTIERYNENCKAGRDSEFNRSREALALIATPPYYAIPLWPACVTASGGPRRDKEARVVGEDGHPIRRLYVAGGLGSIWGFLTLTGGGLTDGMVFGRIAGRNAAREAN